MAKMLIDGILTEKPKPGDGVFRRMSSGFRNRIEPQAEAEFPAACNGIPHPLLHLNKFQNRPLAARART
ncbi:hypothetical protein MACH17_39810 [Phaeobacter inhibens]|uniref:hypothetical protein n=1 Tax=Phaeobacter inhibens TaxID=221822 RepID=UPI002747C8A6|nr:hypothetical protein [Phaeobacter inhibens]GLO72464.1 hypothetical protein MACH17_39810 [Phaeobacter inhibens]